MIEKWNKYIASSDQSTLDLLRPEHEAEMDRGQPFINGDVSWQ